MWSQGVPLGWVVARRKRFYCFRTEYDKVVKRSFMEMTVICVEIEEKIYNRAAEIFERSGLDVPSVIQMFFNMW